MELLVLEVLFGEGDEIIHFTIERHWKRHEFRYFQSFATPCCRESPPAPMWLVIFRPEAFETFTSLPSEEGKNADDKTEMQYAIQGTPKTAGLEFSA